MPTFEVRFVIVVVAVALISACVAYVRHARYTARVQRAAETIRLAADLERQGEVQRAYRAYCQVCEGEFRIDRADMPPNACDRVLPLYRSIVGAYDDTLRALDAYRDKIGRYPELLEEVRAQIPDESLAAFRGFEYERKADSDVSLVTGLYDPATAHFRGSAHQ